MSISFGVVAEAGLCLWSVFYLTIMLLKGIIFRVGCVGDQEQEFVGKRNIFF